MTTPDPDILTSFLRFRDRNISSIRWPLLTLSFLILNNLYIYYSPRLFPEEYIHAWMCTCMYIRLYTCVYGPIHLSLIILTIKCILLTPSLETFWPLNDCTLIRCVYLTSPYKSVTLTVHVSGTPSCDRINSFSFSSFDFVSLDVLLNPFYIFPIGFIYNKSLYILSHSSNLK